MEETLQSVNIEIASIAYAYHYGNPMKVVNTWRLQYLVDTCSRGFQSVNFIHSIPANCIHNG